ncbi:transcription antitermination factor NusB [Mycoplasma phocoenae]|uniref:Transcription antitermination protein NusB n=1 Tax=Mycoplasma phocoenae TaxID=754517 RepID=A0A858U8X9_9MOLU|nr:transcription antitermination factor NusB [Mycoplasma phocoenae]QJG67156.1 transcription antitermination protein NusB [Mycoplasma phocoenae]
MENEELFKRKKQLAFTLKKMEERMRVISYLYQKLLNTELKINVDYLNSEEINIIKKIIISLPNIETLLLNFIDEEKWSQTFPLIKAILIYGIFEMQNNETNIVINEMVNITKIYAPGNDYKFVNAVLDNIAKNLIKK